LNRLRFLSFNIHGGRSLDGIRDLRRVHALMERLDIDIGIFQEMETRPSYGGTTDDAAILAGTSRPYHLLGPSMQEGGGWFGNLIVSRYPIIRGLVHNLETNIDLEPRNAVDALVQTPRGNIRLIGTHLSLSIFERLSEARNLVRLIKAVEEEEKNPIFLMGDINEWQFPSRLLRYLNSHMTPIPCKATFPSFLPIFKLDRIWYDAPGLQVLAHRLPANGLRRLSDHLPLIVEIDYLVNH
jgi:endonuclease/exonuclease/phosphatase family metal-dependent hydrolase